MRIVWNGLGHATGFAAASQALNYAHLPNERNPLPLPAQKVATSERKLKEIWKNADMSRQA
jgi:hypothetical protein